LTVFYGIVAFGQIQWRKSRTTDGSVSTGRRCWTRAHERHARQIDPTASALPPRKRPRNPRRTHLPAATAPTPVLRRPGAAKFTLNVACDVHVAQQRRRNQTAAETEYGQRAPRTVRHRVAIAVGCARGHP